MGFPGSSASKESACNARDPSSIPGSGRLLEKGSATHSSILGFPWCSDGKESTCNSGDLGSIPGLERSPGEGNGNPLQYSGLENSMGLQRVRHNFHFLCKHFVKLSSNFCDVLYSLTNYIIRRHQKF